MDRLSELRGKAGGSRDSTLDTTSPPSEAFMTANDSSKYFSLSEDSEFDISPIKDVTLATADSERTITDDQLISNLSPIGKKADLLDSYKIGKQIEAANILSGGVDIFDDNDNSNEGNELIIDDNVDEDKSNELMLVDTAEFKGDEETLENVSETETPSKDTEVVLQIDGKNVDAIDIGNGLYLYRKEGEEELAAVQIIDDDQQQPSFKFLKVRENAEGNLEVYEEIQIEVPKEVPAKEGKTIDKNISKVPVKGMNKVISESSSNVVEDEKVKTPQKEIVAKPVKEIETDSCKDLQSECKELNFNGKMKLSEARKSPVIGSFTPMTYHSTPNKEGKPLTKTMVDLQLHPNRHSDNVKKTIEVHTDNSKQKSSEMSCKNIKEGNDNKTLEIKCEVKESQGKNSACEEKAKESDLTTDTKQTVKEIPKSDSDLRTENTEVNKIDDPIHESKETDIAEKDDVNKDDKKEQDKSSENLPSQSNLEAIEDKSETSESSEIKNDEVANIVSSSTKEEVGTSSCDSIDSKQEQKIKQNEIPLISTTEKEVKIDEVSSSQEALIPTMDKTSTPECTDSKSLSSNNDKSNSFEQPEQTKKEEEAKSESSEEKRKIESCVQPAVSNPEQSVSKDNSVSLLKSSTQSLAKNTSVLSNVSTQPTMLPKISKEPLISKPKEEAISSNQKTDVNDVKRESAISEPINMITETLAKKTEECKQNLTNETKSDLQANDNTDINKDVNHVEIKKVATSSTDLDKKEIPKVNKPPSPVKPINNNHAAVPFGKWTEANRQEFLNKIKESKVPTNHSNGKQIKNSNDLNRRDILKKIDSQRSNIATAKAQELANNAKLGQGVKKETPIFINKSSVNQDVIMSLKSETEVKLKPDISKNSTKQEIVSKPVEEHTTDNDSTTNTVKKESRTEINNQDLIDKTIDDIIGRSLPAKGQEDTNQNVSNVSTAKSKIDEKPQLKEKPKQNEGKTHEQKPLPIQRLKPNEKSKPSDKLKRTETSKPVDKVNPIEKPKLIATHSTSKSGPNKTLLDNIEMEMNKLHGIPFVERPQHELPQVCQRPPLKTYGKVESDKSLTKHTKVPKLLPFPNKGQQKMIKESPIDLDSEDEIIEHEPITGDIDMNKKTISSKPSSSVPISIPTTSNLDVSKKDSIITENDFDKFARRNSKTYENCLKVNFDGTESHNVIQTVVEKDNMKIGFKPVAVTANSKITQKQELVDTKPAKLHNSMFSGNDPNKNYTSKFKLAYQSAMTAKRQLERPITIIEDKPVKVMYVDSNMDYYPSTLNVQGKELAPKSKKPTPETETNAISSCDSLDSDMGTPDDVKSPDEVKSKTKHQRKQVLTPVETPDLELIEPEDLGFTLSPKKKRRTEDKVEKSPKALVPKKSYLLGRNTVADNKVAKTGDLSQSAYKEPVKVEEPPKSHSTASAIDSLVKAAALIETQSENILKKIADTPSTDSQPVTPVKRGRGRPRKYPLPEGEADKTKAPSSQKKPRLIDAKVKKPEIFSDDDSSEDEIIKENWTMGKINENIVCPICSKLFRSENVVFKHVKHCTGPSPNRSESDKRSTRGRYSQESESTDSKTADETDSEVHIEKRVPKKRKFKENSSKPEVEKDDIIVIEDTPIKERREVKTHESRKLVKNKVPDKLNNLICEICGKTFRQLSYLVSHKIQHGKEEQKKAEPTQVQSRSVFSCDVCKKEFRKLHHLVQHRIIHNPNAMPARLSRKSSLEQKDNKVEKDQVSKQSDDPSAGFRCEPCDKSFRKLHHLVEHRETHDGINRQKNTPVAPANEKLPPPPQCDVCKKTFRKLHHLIEHKEQHLETSSEKSDDKSVKSSLSTKDIIHECSLCYMVFPNEHSLTKHTVICQRKKKQSAAKALKQAEESLKAAKEKDENISEAIKNDDIDASEDVALEKGDTPISEPEPDRKSTETIVHNAPEQKSRVTPENDKPQPIIEKESEKDAITKESNPKPVKEIKTENTSKVPSEPEIPAKNQKTDEKETGKTPKKKTPAKEKSATVTKRQKSVNAPLPVVEEYKPLESSDDDDVRYMLNPDFKVEETAEAKMFMKVKANKRNSLQIERPNSKDLVKRRISLQHPPKIPRLKPKPVETKAAATTTIAQVKNVLKPQLDAVPSTDSDDSDVKYSFPKTVVEKPKTVTQETKDVKKVQRKSMADKRKSLIGIAKRKSIGKVITAKHKVKPSPMKPVKRRIAEIEHRCDCGQLFSSAALLSRHTTLAHTPPRIRRKRSPPPDIDTKTIVKAAPKKPPTEIPRPSADSRKSSTRSDTSSKERKNDAKETRKSIKTDESKNSSSKTRRSAAHRGVPVPEKMRKLMEKNK
ncbi:uncharacterized protein LOC106130367 [Amyelois transitella]|uniref:uncharacterized protein LOC106130367 n=1 Tax=Amyelois transitella TaxID=680683 RepID=UPI00067E57D0|nr:uncharacterized protein LOC106130367 [Amyelois transitella]XP_013184650.1 uncharacterized protein LOC106130367 [Amyelois transitella]